METQNEVNAVLNVLENQETNKTFQSVATNSIRHYRERI